MSRRGTIKDLNWGYAICQGAMDLSRRTAKHTDCYIRTFFAKAMEGLRIDRTGEIELRDIKG